MQVRYSMNLKNAPYCKIMSIEHVRHNSICSRYFIKYSIASQVLMFVYKVGQFCQCLLQKQEMVPFTRVNMAALGKKFLRKKVIWCYHKVKT